MENGKVGRQDQMISLMFPLPISPALLSHSSTESQPDGFEDRAAVCASH